MNTNHQIRDFLSGLVTSYEDLTPTKLRLLAVEMEGANIQSICFYAQERYGNAEFVCEEKRLETDSERDARVTLERQQAESRDAWQRRQYEELKRKYEGI